ncbi:hypothetical protein [Thomasclavelia cocleata]|uniref:hypothetical protein n=1 Tax=Thomasclavelia cocleata TaxID=69824 RepID=UPI00256EF9BC|nr:hypothetical protein [Thomasclavelia cocleata]
MKNTYLLQAGTFLNINEDEIIGFDSIIDLKYMGACEFEGIYDSLTGQIKNPLNLSLKRIVKNMDSYIVKKGRQKTKNGDNVLVFAKSEDVDEVKKRVTKFANNKLDLKRFVSIKLFMENPDSHFSNFFWDIENDFFIFFGEANAKKLEIALNKMKEKWHDELFPPKKKSFFAKLKNVFIPT